MIMVTTVHAIALQDARRIDEACTGESLRSAELQLRILSLELELERLHLEARGAALARLVLPGNTQAGSAGRGSCARHR
jgi:hypothetical protein